MRKNKIKEMMKAGKPVINGWLQIPSTVSAEVMAHQGWDSLTIDMQHGLVDYTNALPMLQPNGKQQRRSRKICSSVYVPTSWL